MSWLNGSKGGQKAAALAEVAWSAPESLSGYQDFLGHLTGAMIPSILLRDGLSQSIMRKI